MRRLNYNLAKRRAAWPRAKKTRAAFERRRVISTVGKLTARFSPLPPTFLSSKNKAKKGSVPKFNSSRKERRSFARVKETRWILIERYREKSFVYDIRGNFSPDPYFIFFAYSRKNARYFISPLIFILPPREGNN